MVSEYKLFACVPVRLMTVLAAVQGLPVHRVAAHGTDVPNCVNMPWKAEKVPIPARRTVLPLPKMSHAAPMRGLKLVLSPLNIDRKPGPPCCCTPPGTLGLKLPIPGLHVVL